MMKKQKTTFKAIMTGVVLLWLAIILVFVKGCASKSIRFSTMDESGMPVEIEANIVYFCTDQKTNDFSAVAPGGLKIKFAGQESNAKTEVALEFLRLLNSLPAQ